jgi:hypothetical protein
MTALTRSILSSPTLVLESIQQRDYSRRDHEERYGDHDHDEIHRTPFLVMPSRRR